PRLARSTRRRSTLGSPETSRRAPWSAWPGSPSGAARADRPRSGSGAPSSRSRRLPSWPPRASSMSWRAWSPVGPGRPPPSGSGAHARVAAPRAAWERLRRDGGPSELLAEVPFWRAVALVQAGDTEAALRTLAAFRASVRPDHPLLTASLAQRGWAELVGGAIDAAQRDFLAAE